MTTLTDFLTTTISATSGQILPFPTELAPSSTSAWQTSTPTTQSTLYATPTLLSQVNPSTIALAETQTDIAIVFESPAAAAMGSQEAWSTLTLTLPLSSPFPPQLTTIAGFGPDGQGTTVTYLLPGSSSTATSYPYPEPYPFPPDSDDHRGGGWDSWSHSARAGCVAGTVLGFLLLVLLALLICCARRQIQWWVARNWGSGGWGHGQGDVMVGGSGHPGWGRY